MLRGILEADKKLIFHLPPTATMASALRELQLVLTLLAKRDEWKWRKAPTPSTLCCMSRDAAELSTPSMWREEAHGNVPFCFQGLVPQ